MADDVSSPIDIQKLMELSNSVTAVATNAAKILTKGTVDAAEIIATRIDRGTAAIPDEILVETQKSAAELQRIQNSRAAATAFAVNQDEANQMVSRLGAAYVASSSRAMDISEEIRQRSNVSLFEKPLEWLGNQIVIPFRQDELHANVETAKLAASTLQTANAVVQSQAQTDNLIKQSVTTETQDAQQRLIKAAAEDKLAQLKLQGIALNSGNVKAVFEMTSAQLDTYFKINQVFNQEQYLKLAKESHRIQTARWEQELKEKQDIATEEATIAETVNAGRAALNLPPLPSKQIKQQLKMGGEVSRVLQENYITGASIKASGLPLVGESPAKAAEVIVRSSAPLTVEQQGVKKFLVDTVGTAAATVPPTVDAKNPKAVTDHVNGVVTNAANAQQKNIKTGDASNIYAISSVTAIAESELVKGTPFHAVVLKPLVDTGYNKVDPEDLVSKTLAALQTKQIDYTQAVNGLAAFFRVGAAVNNETRRYNMFGLPTQTSYNVKVTTSFGAQSGSAFGGGAVTETFDLTDPRQISILFSRKLAEQINRQPRLTQGEALTSIGRSSQ
jgi:hypothetical protein